MTPRYLPSASAVVQSAAAAATERDAVINPAVMAAEMDELMLSLLRDVGALRAKLDSLASATGQQPQCAPPALAAAYTAATSAAPTVSLPFCGDNGQIVTVLQRLKSAAAAARQGHYGTASASTTRARPAASGAASVVDRHTDSRSQRAASAAGTIALRAPAAVTVYTVPAVATSTAATTAVSINDASSGGYAIESVAALAYDADIDFDASAACTVQQRASAGPSASFHKRLRDR